MLATVEFDDEMRVGTKEIDDITIDRKLSSEFPPEKPAVAETKPQQPLRIRLIAA